VRENRMHSSEGGEDASPSRPLSTSPISRARHAGRLDGLVMHTLADLGVPEPGDQAHEQFRSIA